MPGGLIKEGAVSDVELDAKKIEEKVSDLALAMDRVRNDLAERDDVVVEMKQAGRARLELLAQQLQPVFKDIPDHIEQFDFALTDGETPRLWIDMTSFVRLGRDRRVYEFVKDTRMGRTMLGETDDRSRMAKIVSNYVAERIIERERMIEGEWVAMRDYQFGLDEEAGVAGEAAVEAKRPGFDPMWFLIGLLGGAAAIFAWAWFGDIAGFIANLRLG